MSASEIDAPEAVCWDESADVLVFGSGVGGLSAALLAAKAGQRVLICEKTSKLGGTTATSGGIAWIPNSVQARKAAVPDSIELARTYLKHELGNHYRADLIDAFLESGGEALAALEDGTDVKFDLVKRPDYHASRPGGLSTGRSLETRKFDGRELGADFELVRPPKKRLMLLGGIHVDKRKVDDFLNPFRSFETFKRAAGTLARYAMDRMRFSRGTDIGAGNALIGRLLLSLKKRKVEIWVDSPLVELICGNGKVQGAMITRSGIQIRVRAKHAVVLATGGFPHSATMREKFSGAYPHRYSVGFEGNVGEGIEAAREIGGVVDTNLVSPAFWQPSSLLKHSDDSEETILYGYLDRGRPGVIAVDSAATRFVNESNSYHDIVIAMFERGAAQGNAFYFICDRRFLWKRGLGMIRPFTVNLKPYLKSGYIVMADTLPELAQRINLPPDDLVATVHKHNGYAITGVDLEFGKGSDPYNRLFGDPKVGPNPNLAPIERPPFVALRIYPSTLGTAVGLKTNANAQVLNAAGEAVMGLYACGNDLASIMRGYYPGGGITIGPAIVFAYRAINHILESRRALDS